MDTLLNMINVNTVDIIGIKGIVPGPTFIFIIVLAFIGGAFFIGTFLCIAEYEEGYSCICFVLSIIIGICCIYAGCKLQSKQIITVKVNYPEEFSQALGDMNKDTVIKYLGNKIYEIEFK